MPRSRYMQPKRNGGKARGQTSETLCRNRHKVRKPPIVKNWTLGNEGGGDKKSGVQNSSHPIVDFGKIWTKRKSRRRITRYNPKG